MKYSSCTKDEEGGGEGKGMKVHQREENFLPSQIGTGGVGSGNFLDFQHDDSRYEDANHVHDS